MARAAHRTCLLDSPAPTSIIVLAMEITPPVLSQQLDRLCARVESPAAGVFGPDTVFWRVQRHSVLFAGAGRAALLQLAHPFVARAISEHSPVATDPFGRFRRTFQWIFPMVFGDLDQALNAARIVHRGHSTIRGTFDSDAGVFSTGSAYSATDLDATRWVHATLWETSVRMYEAYVDVLSRAEKELYYAESRRFAALFGIEPECLPPNWDTFQEYNRSMWESTSLTVTDEARALARALFRPRHPVSRVLLVAYERWVAQGLPDRLRRDYGFEAHVRGIPTPLFERAFRSQWLWPRSVRYVPAYHHARVRLGAAAGLPPISRLLERRIFVRRKSSEVP